MTIGAHGHSHRILARLPAQEQEREVGRCAEWLRSLCDGPVDWFCYPYGKQGTWNADTVAALRANEWPSS